ncbi:IucA/IucC family siderophore biosynthesis protein [Saccharopolyspora sp. HNM0983]|uniref:IucA/IucC family siderophore biosynthesis protein n=1 Tax=Saccharopolyspora montiporae TaxID=2781240 RepID=A0A929B8R4_9PSEU|nr:IucA/IucC family siderophore biosynthesis protein [Saccharopolyspora sp. HNM0983]MBE9373496.1 IucA/IucC family siderophore biosynthesis protein [Saccharopolyspora sp. HNM0983]
MNLSAPPELDPGTWQRAGRALLAKSLGELAYEQLLDPVLLGDGRYRVDAADGISYTFSATRGAFLDWRVDQDSVLRTDATGEHPAHDPLRFFLDAYRRLGISGETAGHLVRELTATLNADVRLLAESRTSAELAELSYIELEGHQTGHPWLIPNKGRIGFSAADAAEHAPEGRNEHRLPWMAVHRSLADYRSVKGSAQDTLLKVELDPQHHERFEKVLTDRGLDPAEYLWMPVHPWQWDQTVLPLFAPDVAAGRIVALGEGPDRYLAQQSIRTFGNIDNPERHFVKLPLSILNTLVWRGLPTERTAAAPAVTGWILGIAESDPFLRASRAVLLGEVASVTVRHHVLEEVENVPYQYRELLGAIWREPLNGKLAAGERARTLASLLHVDHEGEAFVAELVRRSGLDAETWLQRLFHSLLPPLLHFLYRYGVVFSPHGENTIVVFDSDEAPCRLAVKDFVDDVNISSAELPELADLPADVDAALLREPPEFLRQFIQSGLFVGHFRYLAPLVEQHLGVPESTFWTFVRNEVQAYQQRFPELAERYRMFDLMTPEIDRLCLNRNRLLLDTYRDRAERPHAAVHGTIPNPLHG